MKNLLFAIALVLSTVIYAQERTANNFPFVRIFDLQGKKVYKGQLLSLNDTTLILKKKKTSIGIHYEDIGSIKTKRSAGNNILSGASIGGATLGALVAASANPGANFLSYNSGEGFAMGAILGGTGGAVIGALTIPFKRSKKYIINADINKWTAFKELLHGVKTDNQNKRLDTKPLIL